MSCLVIIVTVGRKDCGFPLCVGDLGQARVVSAGNSTWLGRAHRDDAWHHMEKLPYLSASGQEFVISLVSLCLGLAQLRG
jgi:hypothetical protein